MHFSLCGSVCVHGTGSIKKTSQSRRSTNVKKLYVQEYTAGKNNIF